MPLSFLRYSYIFLCLIAGPLGMYFFLYKILLKKKIPSFLGALFYLLNLGTYQTFLVPFEMFTTLFATLPYVFWLFASYLKRPKKFTLFFFAVAIIFTAPAAYASTLWFIFFLSLILFFAPFVFLQKKTHGIVKRFFVLLGLIIVLNLYWILPNIYFALSQGSFVASANINKLFSEEAFLKNKEFGNIKDILFLKSFYFDWGIYNYKTGGFEQLTNVFRTYLQAPLVQSIGYIIASFIVIGFVFTIKTARRYFISFLLLTLFCFLFLFNANPPFSSLFSFFQNHIPLFKEALRFPDDKILNIFVFLVSIFFSYAALFLTSLFKKGKHVLGSLMLFTFSLIIVIPMLPAFSGNLIHPSMRVSIPPSYFSLFEELKKDTDGRVANFPVQSPWGWVYHNWYGNSAPSFQGAGFLYFGTTPSIMERDFDRWNPLNEEYYREVSHAVYANNKNELKNVFEKFGITSVLLDTSVITPGTDGKSLYYQQLSEMFETLKAEGYFTGKKTFSPFLTLYKITSHPRISTLSTVQSISSAQFSSYKDIYYEQYGNYALLPNTNSSFYPTSLLTDNELKVKPHLLNVNDTLLTLNLPKLIYQSKESTIQNDIPSTVVASKTESAGTQLLSISLYPQTPLFDDAPLLAPIKGDFEYPTSANAVLAINRQVFPLSTLPPQSPTAVGNAFLNTTVNTVALFNRNDTATTYQVSEIPLNFAYCNFSNNAGLSMLAHPDSLVLTGLESDSVCITIPLSFIKTPQTTSATLILLQFSLKNPNISLCLTNPLNDSCADYLPFTQQDGIVTVNFALNKNDLSTTKLLLTVPKGDREQTLSRLLFTSYQALSETTLASSFFKNTIPPTFKTVTIPKNIDKNYYAKAEAGTLPNNDCKNTVSETKKEFDAKNQRYIYTSTVGSYCDHFSFPNLPHSLSYFVFVKSERLKGLPMNFCITNYTSRKCDIYAKLTNQNENVFLLPESDPQGTGYDVNLENVGVKGSEGINAFYEVSFVPFSPNLLSTIYSGREQKYAFTGHITDSTEYNPQLITTTTSGSPSLVTLSYAYNKGFLAYPFNCSGILCPLSLLFRPLFGKALPHVIVNGWENGWISQNEGTIAIIFLPQYLEYFGILVFILTVTMLFVYTFFNVHKSLPFNEYFEGKTRLFQDKISSLLSKD